MSDLSAVDMSSAEDDDYEDEAVELSSDQRYVRFKDRLWSGNGNCKEVFRAVDTDLGIEVAWNRVPLSRLHLGKQVVKEIAVFQGIRHPNIIDFYHYWVDESKEQIVFITELLPSGTLLKFIEKSPRVRLKVIKHWCKQILQGLEYLHTRDPPVIHRDIKCDNIFINGTITDGEVKIGDLGLATFSKNNEHSLSVFGTTHFMAPEYYTSSYSTGVDIWAFGMTLLEMISCVKPYFECSSIGKIVEKVSAGILPLQFGALQDEKVKEFVHLCFLPEGERPTATALLAHSFFSADETDNVPVAFDESAMVVEHPDNQSIEAPVAQPIVGNSPTLSRAPSKTAESSTDATPPQAPEPLPQPVPIRKSSSVSRDIPRMIIGTPSKMTTNSNYHIEVVVVNTTDPEDQVINMKLMIDDGSEQNEVEFDFDLRTDSPAAVAQEMVDQITQDESTFEGIRDLIQEQVQMFHDHDLSEPSGSPSVSPREEHAIRNLIHRKSPRRYLNHVPMSPARSSEALSYDNDSLAELVNSPQFTCPPQVMNTNADIEEMEALLDESDEETEEHPESSEHKWQPPPSPEGLFDLDADDADLLSDPEEEEEEADTTDEIAYADRHIPDEAAMLSNEEKLARMKMKHEIMRKALLAQQQHEMKALETKRKLKNTSDGDGSGKKGDKQGVIGLFASQLSNTNYISNEDQPTDTEPPSD